MQAVTFRIRWLSALCLALSILAGGCARAPSDLRTVVRVVDGDTLMLDGEERVRLIGVDTPERRPVECFAREATAFTRRLAQGRRVRLEYDWNRKDRWGRTLAYVYLENGTFLNAEIIRQGYGHALTRYPFKYLDEFRRYEREARQASRGLWGAACLHAGGSPQSAFGTVL